MLSFKQFINEVNTGDLRVAVRIGKYVYHSTNPDHGHSQQIDKLVNQGKMSWDNLDDDDIKLGYKDIKTKKFYDYNKYDRHLDISEKMPFRNKRIKPKEISI